MRWYPESLSAWPPPPAGGEDVSGGVVVVCWSTVVVLPLGSVTVRRTVVTFGCGGAADLCLSLSRVRKYAPRTPAATPATSRSASSGHARDCRRGRYAMGAAAGTGVNGRVAPAASASA